MKYRHYEYQDFNNLPTWLPPRIAALGWSPEDFARKINISRAQVYRYLNDHGRPTTQTMAKICRVLGVSLEEGLRQYVDKPTGRPIGSGGIVRELAVRQ